MLQIPQRSSPVRSAPAPGRAQVAITALLLVVAAVVDWLRPLGMTFSMLYLLPAIYAAWRLPRWARRSTYLLVPAAVFLVPLLSRPEASTAARLVSRAYGTLVGGLIVLLISGRRRQGAVLQAANDQLADRVSARSAELEEANRVLVEEIDQRRAAEQALQRRLVEMTVLQRIGLICSQARHEDEMLRQATELIAESLFPDNCGFLLLDAAAGVLRSHPSFFLANPAAERLDIPLDVGVVGLVARSGAPRRVADVRQEPAYLAVDDLARSELCVPIRVGRKVVGVVDVESHRLDAFSPDAEQVVGTIADLVGNALERLRTEEALRASERELRELADAMPQIVWRTDALGNLEYCNGRTPQYGGGPAEEWLGQNWQRFVHPDDLPRMLELVSEALGSGRTYNLEHRLRRADGEYRWHITRGVAVRDASGAVSHWFGTTTDVHELKQTAAALVDSNERLRLATEAAHMGIWDHDLRSGRLVWTADRQRLSELPPAAQAESYDAFCALLHPADRSALAEAQRRALADNGEYRAEFRFPLPCGRVRWGVIRGRLLLDERGQPERIVGVELDVTERKHVEQALREAERRLEMVLSGADIGVWDWDLATNQVAFSGNWKSQLGYAEHEIRDRYEEWTSRIHPDDAEPTLAKVRAAIERCADDYEAEFRLRHKDGSWRWILARGFVLAGAGGQPARMLGVHLDITERKQAEAALRRQKQVLEGIVQRRPLAELLERVVSLMEGQLGGPLCSILLVDQQGRLRHGAARNLPEEYNRAVDGVAIGPNVGSCGTAAFRRRTVVVADIATDPLWEGCRELALVHGLRSCWSVPILAGQAADPASGAEVVLGTLAVYGRQPGLPSPGDLEIIAAAAHLAGIAIEQRQADERLRASEARLRTLLENLDNVAVLAYDPDGTITIWNRASERLYGYSAEEALGRDIVALLHGEDGRAAQRGVIDEALRTGQPPAAEEVEVVDRHGRRVWVYASRILHPRPGKAPELFSFEVDITDRKRAEEELAARQVELLHASRLSTVGQMVAALSHEVAQPLSAIGNFAAAAEALLEGDDACPPTTLREYVSAISAQSRRCGAILQRLRDFSRKAHAPRARCDLNALLRDAVELLASDLRRGDVSVCFDLADALPPVLVDRVQMEQVVVNLLTNAGDAVRDLPAQQRQITIHTRPDQAAAVFEVRDLGPGLPAAGAGRVFEPFFTTKQQGMGIGLSICRTIVRDHGGRIEAWPNVPRGATFQVTLPAAADE